MTDEYRVAQRAIADLKAAVLTYVKTHGPVRNSDIGRALGIYFGHGEDEGRHVGHVSRSILRLLEDEGLVVQDESKGWSLAARWRDDERPTSHLD